MKAALFILALVAFSYAQSPDQEIDRCTSECCDEVGGEWDGAGRYCYVEDDAQYDRLSDCQLSCLYEEAGVRPGDASACCCGPAAILLALLGAVLRRKA